MVAGLSLILTTGASPDPDTDLLCNILAPFWGIPYLGLYCYCSSHFTCMAASPQCFGIGKKEILKG